MTVTITQDTDTFTTEWQRWHTQRVGAAKAPYGLAAVTGTHWLTSEPTEFPGVPGRWSTENGRVVGVDVTGGPLDIAVGEALRLGGTDLEVRALSRDDAVGVRVVDPNARTRVELVDIDAYDPDPSWVVEGRFTAAESGSTISVDHVDGAVTTDPLAGWVEVQIDGVTESLAAFPQGEGRLQISFGDATNGSETARFRFLSLPAPDADGVVPVDFNRAYLPPSTFTDHYLCPLPSQANRLASAVRAGEKVPVRDRRGE